MDDKTLVVIFGIGCLTAYGTILALLGINHAVSSAIISAIAGTVGYYLRGKTERWLKRYSKYTRKQ